MNLKNIIKPDRSGPRRGTKKFWIDGFDINDSVKLLIMVIVCEFAGEAITDLKHLDIPYLSNMAGGALAAIWFLARQWMTDNSHIQYNEHEKRLKNTDG